MKHIAVIIYSKIVGGHEFQTKELIKDLSKNDKVDIIVDKELDIEKLGELTYANKILPLSLVRAGNFLFQLLHSIKLRKYRSFLKRYDTIIVSGGSIEATIAPGYSLKGLNIIAYVPTFVDRKKLWKNIMGSFYNLLFYLFSYPFKKILTINKIQSKLFSKYTSTLIIPNRVVVPNHLETSSNTKENKRLYYVGRLEPLKGILELIEFLDCKENPFKEILIIGDGSLYKEIKEKSNTSKYIKIHLLGWLSTEGQNKILNKNDIYVTNSYLEGEPLAIIEANNRGSVVIASNIDGHRGCVAKKNRFSNQEELLILLNKAIKGELKTTKNITVDEIETLRERAIKQLSLL